MKSKYVILIIFLSLISCEGTSSISGIITNPKNNKVLQNVLIIYNEDRHSIVNSDTIYSDRNGKFKISNLIMCNPKCPNTELIFKKEGFKTKTINFKEKILDTILKIDLEPTEN